MNSKIFDRYGMQIRVTKKRVYVPVDGENKIKLCIIDIKKMDRKKIPTITFTFYKNENLYV